MAFTAYFFVYIKNTILTLNGFSFLYFKINKLHIKTLIITGQTTAEAQCAIAKGVFNGIRSSAKVIHGKYNISNQK